jgi:hypothetical protein
MYRNSKPNAPGDAISASSRSTTFADLSSDVQAVIFAHAGTPWWTCKTAASLADILLHDHHLARRWFTAHNIRPLSGAAGRGWWAMVRDILEEVTSVVHSMDFGPVLLAAVHSKQHEVIGLLLSKHISTEDVNCGSQALSISVKQIVQKLCHYLCRSHIGMYHTNRAWAAFFAMIESIRQKDLIAVKMLLPEVTCSERFYSGFKDSWVLEAERKMLLSQVAAASGDLDILEILWSQSMLSLELVVRAVAHIGNLHVWQWCIQHVRNMPEGLSKNCQLYFGKCAGMALRYGHVELCASMQSDLNQYVEIEYEIA